MIDSDSVGTNLEEFAADLRGLLRESRFGSFRQLAQHLNYSHEIVAKAARGKDLPSKDLTRAFVLACGGDPAEWEAKWHRVSRRGKDGPESVVPSQAWSTQDLVDGADPEDSGCYVDAVTIHAKRVSLTEKRHVIGQIELRHSPRSHAAWGRFKGTDGLDKLAMFRYKVDLVVGVGREQADGLRLAYPTEYGFDYHWGNVVLTGTGVFYGWVEVQFDGRLVAVGETDRVELR